MTTLLSRKKFIQSAIVACAALCVGVPSVQAQTSPTAIGGSALNLTYEWDKTFPKSNKVDPCLSGCHTHLLDVVSRDFAA